MQKSGDYGVDQSPPGPSLGPTYKTLRVILTPACCRPVLIITPTVTGRRTHISQGLAPTGPSCGGVVLACCSRCYLQSAYGIQGPSTFVQQCAMYAVSLICTLNPLEGLARLDFAHIPHTLTACPFSARTAVGLTMLRDSTESLKSL